MISKNKVFELNNNNLNEILDKYFPDILKAIETESYEIEYPNHFLFRKITFEDAVVGFMTFELLQYYGTEIALNECYILPEYRGNNLLARELINLIETPNISLHIRRPSKSIMKSLLNNDLAISTEKGTVISFIPLIVEKEDIYKNKRIRKHVKSIPINNQLIYFSLAYDFEIGSVVFKHAQYYYPFGGDEILISKPRKIDANKKIEKISPNYLKNLSDDIYSNRILISQLKDSVYSRIRKDLSVENLIGLENNLNHDFTDALYKNNLTVDEGLKIRENIIMSLDNNEIRHKGIKNRINYLMGVNVKKQADSMDLKCPYCENRVQFYFKTCSICGHDLTVENTFNTVKNIIHEYSRDINYIAAREDNIVDGSNMYQKLIDWACENDYDLDEVYEAQCEYSCFEILQNLGTPGNFSIGVGWDTWNKIREGSALIYAINHEYIENLTEERYKYELENTYSISNIQRELYDYGIDYQSNDRDELISQIFEDEYFNRFLDEHFVLTQKGETFLKNELLEYFYKYLSEDNHYYCEFKKLYLENKDDLTLDEMAIKLKNGEI